MLRLDKKPLEKKIAQQTLSQMTQPNDSQSAQPNDSQSAQPNDTPTLRQQIKPRSGKM